MPGFYNEDEYDLAGFCVGVVDKDKIIDGSKVEDGDVVLGLKSTGIHSNGYSLVRKIVFEKENMDVDKFIPELGTTIGEELLKPTRIYTKTVLPLIEKFDIKGIVHITGGGFYENIPRIVPEGLQAVINTRKIKTPRIFDLLQQWANISRKEMYSTFNMGIGMILIIKKDEADKISNELREQGEEFVLLGEIKKGKEKVLLCH